MRGLFTVVAAALLFAATARADEFAAKSGSGSMWIHEAAAAQLGLAITPVGDAARDTGLYREHDVRLAGALAFDFGFGHYAYSRSGSLALRSRVAVTAQGRTKRLALALVPHRGGDTHFALATPDGAIWFTLDDVHQRYDGGREVAFGYQDLRVGPALAAFAAQPAASGQFVGAMHFRLQGKVAMAGKATEACLSPNWPGTNGTTTDVALNAMAGAQAICPTCNGAASSTARAKIVPSVELRNVGTADVPWFTLFYDPSSPLPLNTPPPPYGVSDPHPALVWNVYRIDAAGRLAQVARSGLKHAFATNNDGCSCGNFRVLAPNCRDTYNVASNEFDSALGPRSDVIAHTGEFGRCGSRFDDVDENDPSGVCDGQDDRSAIGAFDYRAVVEESLLASGGRWFVEAWYVVRNDVNLYNTMGTREFTPTWSTNASGAGFWAMPVADAGLVAGSILDRYAAMAQPSNAQVLVRDLATPTGRLKLLSRAESIGGGRWRYEYQLGNYEFSRPVTSGAGDTLRVLRNRGIAGVTFPTDADAQVAGVEFVDATGTAADDWTAAIGPGSVAFTAPATNTLDWGSTYRVSFTSTREPVAGNATLAAYEGLPATFEVEVLLPTGAEALLLDGFE